MMSSSDLKSSSASAGERCVSSLATAGRSSGLAGVDEVCAKAGIIDKRTERTNDRMGDIIPILQAALTQQAQLIHRPVDEHGLAGDQSVIHGAEIATIV